MIFFGVLFVPEPPFRLRGLYVEALCEGIRTVLRPYKAALARLERAILEKDISSSSSSCSHQLTSLQHSVSPFHPVFLALNSLLSQLRIRRCHGCFVLDVVYKETLPGVAEVQDAMKT